MPGNRLKNKTKKRHKQTLKSPYLDRVSKVALGRDETVIFAVWQPVSRGRGAPAVANVLTSPPVSAAAFSPLFPLCPHTVQVSPRGNIPDSRHLDSHLEFSGCDTKGRVDTTLCGRQTDSWWTETEQVDAGKMPPSLFLGNLYFIRTARFVCDCAARDRCYIVWAVAEWLLNPVMSHSIIRGQFRVHDLLSCL